VRRVRTGSGAAEEEHDRAEARSSVRALPRSSLPSTSGGGGGDSFGGSGRPPSTAGRSGWGRPREGGRRPTHEGMVEDGNDTRTKGNEREPLWGEKRKSLLQRCGWSQGMCYCLRAHSFK
jgi:hypothetical protein